MSRVFKSGWFSKGAKKAIISDSKLCVAFDQVLAGQADDLGGGVLKKRLSDDNYRSIILAKGGSFWIYSFLFAKKDRSNIDENKLKSFCDLAKIYAEWSTHQANMQVIDGHWIEICQITSES